MKRMCTVFSLGIFIISSLCFAAEEGDKFLEKKGGNAFFRKNNVGIHGGYHQLSRSDYFQDISNNNHDDFDSGEWGIEYQRMIFHTDNYKLNIGLDFDIFSAGSKRTVFHSDKTLDVNADREIVNYQFMSNLRNSFIIINDFLSVYIGVGIGPTYTTFDYTIKDRNSDTAVKGKSDFLTFTVQGLAGTEIMLSKENAWNIPASVYFEYRYSRAVINNFDKDFNDDFQDTFHTDFTDENHEMDVGGNSYIGGIRWYF